MTTLQFSLFFAGLLIAYLLVHVRLVRFERYLSEISGLKALNERLERVAQSLERVRLDRAEQGLATLHDDLVALADGQAGLERVLRRSGAAVVVAPQPVSQAVAPLSAAGQVRSLVTERLLALGYGNLRILSDLVDVSLDERVEVSVECERNRIGYKGKVVTHNGAVLDVQMQSTIQAFP